MSNLRTRPRTAVIIGAGPAGLTAAYELLTRTDVRPVVIEMSGIIGGISATVKYKGNRIDIGGHRFFSKSDRVMKWWLQHLPLEEQSSAEPLGLRYQGQSRELAVSEGVDAADHEHVMLVRERKSRIYFLRKFFDYPISLSPDTIKKLGLVRTARIGLSYFRRTLFPLKEVKNLEQFFINRFGDRLYRTFFKSYTEKVWGVPCTDIDAEWGAQRIKNLSVWKTIKHFVGKKLRGKTSGVSQKDTETHRLHRAVPLSEVRAGADVGRSRAEGRGNGRNDCDGTGRAAAARTGQPHRRRDHGGSFRTNFHLRGRLCVLHHAGADLRFAHSDAAGARGTA